MSNCSKFSEQINLYIDNELEQSKVLELMEHIKSCESCAKELEMMQEVQRCISEEPMLDLPADFENTLHEKLSKAQEPQKIIPFYKNWRTYSAVAAVILFAFILKTGLLDDNKIINSEIATPTPFVESQITAGVKQQPESTQNETKSTAENKMTNKNNYNSERKVTVETKSPQTQVPTQSPENDVKNINEDKKEFNDIIASPSPTPKAEPSILPSAGTEVKRQVFEDVQVTDTTPPAPQSSSAEMSMKSSGIEGSSSGASTAEPPLMYSAVALDSPFQVVVITVQEQDFEKASGLFEDKTYLISDIKAILDKNNIKYKISNEVNDTTEYKINIQIQNNAE